MTTAPNSALFDALAQRRALKVISGLQNFDLQSVLKVTRAAQQGGATWVDIAASPELVQQVRAQIELPICVSAVDPQQLAEAVRAGANAAEIGNYDSFYASGRIFSAAEVLDLTRQARALLPRTLLSVTVPHTLPLDQQAELAEKLEDLGADLIQTEGGTSADPAHGGSLGLVEKAAPTLAAAYEISRMVSIPVICASGLSAVTVRMAIAAGASGVGVGKAINQLQDEVAMVAQVRALMKALTGVGIPAAV
jgi:thiamine monophosphate synthase